MARTVAVKINGTEYHMPAGWKASRDVAQEVGDPLVLSMKAYTTGELELTTEDVVSIIHIGCRHAGCGLDRDAIGEAIFEEGLLQYLEVCGNYLGAFVQGGPTRGKPSKKGKPSRGSTS